MTRKIYKTAMGKTVDLGALLLQNEQVRAVGNMNVNSVGDLLDSNNQVIDQRNKQMQRQYKKQSNVSDTPVPTSNLSARKAHQEKNNTQQFKQEPEPVKEVVVPTPAQSQSQVQSQNSQPSAGGLAAAIARSREIKQELEKTRRQQMQDQGLKKI